MARDYDGGTDQTVISDATELRPGASSYSVLMSVSPNDVNENGSFISKRVNTSPFQNWTAGISGDADFGSSGKKLIGFLNESTTPNRFRRSVSVSDVADGNYHKVAIIGDTVADECRLFSDGSELSKTTNNAGTYPDINNTEAWSIGNNTQGSFGVAGDCAEIGMYNAVVDDINIVSHSRGVSLFAIRPDIRVFYMPMFGNQDPEPEMSSDTHTGVVTGTTKSPHPLTEFMENYL